MSEDSEFEQGLEMLMVALAFSDIKLLRIADLPAKWPISPGLSGWDSFDSLGSACFGLRVFLRLLEATLGLLLLSPSHVIFNLYGPHIILCSTEVVPDDASFNFCGPHGALFRNCMVPVYYVSLVSFATSALCAA